MADCKIIAVERRPDGYGVAMRLPLAGRLFGIGPSHSTHAAALIAAEAEALSRGGLKVVDQTEGADA